MSRAGARLRTAAGDGGPSRRHLRPVDAWRGERFGEDEGLRQRDYAPHEHSNRVLVAGADRAVRARMLAELRSLLPADTDFREAGETWEVIAQACESRMVVLAGDLGETSASTLLRLLALRNPSLPVLAVGGEQPLHAPSQARDPGDGRYRRAVDAAHA